MLLPDLDLAQAATQQLASGIQHLGEQDAARERDPVSQRPGAWAGTVVYTNQGVARKFISQAKWDKLKEHLEWFTSHLSTGSEVNRKAFESKVGFLLHVADTYEFAKPYLQGFFLAYHAFHPDRDAHGYRWIAEDNGTSKDEAGVEETGDKEIERH